MTCGTAVGARMTVAMTPTFRVAALLLLLIATTVSCRRDDQAVAPAAVEPPQHRFSFTLADNPIQIRLAVLPAEQRRGLMETESLPENEGMLFVYVSPQRMSFWMRNTPLPLDIGYFDASGVLREIYPLYPHVEDPVASRQDDLQFALEMNQGWYAAHGVKPGAQLDLAELAEALKARGFAPERFLKAERPLAVVSDSANFR